MTNKVASITALLVAVSTILALCVIYGALGWAIVHFAMKYW